jgi:thioredoxin-like negative regulator of GroEL
MMEFGLSGVPSMILFKDGLPQEKTSGYRPKAQLEQWLSKFVG